MLSSYSSLITTDFAIKMVFEVVCDNLGYTFVANDGVIGKIRVNKHTGGEYDLHALGRICYEIVNVTPISSIVSVVACNTGNMLDILKEYIYSQEFSDRVNELLAIRVNAYNPYPLEQERKDVAYMQNFLYLARTDRAKVEPAINHLFSMVEDKLSQLSPNNNVYQMCALLSRIRLGLRNQAVNMKQPTRRGNNYDVFASNPSLAMELEQDFIIWLKDGMNLTADRWDTVIMTRVMGHYIKSYFLRNWFKDNIRNYTVSTTYTSNGKQYSKSDYVLVEQQKFEDIDIQDVMSRLARVSKTLFEFSAIGNRINGLRSRLGYESEDRDMLRLDTNQYTVLEYYVEYKLSSAVAKINSSLHSIMKSKNHKLTNSIRSNYTKYFRFASGFSVNRIANTPISNTCEEFSARIRIGIDTIRQADKFRRIVSPENLDSKFRSLVDSISAKQYTTSDSNYQYIRYHHQYTRTDIENNYLPKMLISDTGYSRTEELIHCLCDLDRLDSALGRYGLTIADMATPSILESGIVENIHTVEDLLAYITQGVSIQSNEYSDSFRDVNVGDGSNFITHHFQAVSLSTITEMMEQAIKSAATQNTDTSTVINFSNYFSQSESENEFHNFLLDLSGISYHSNSPYYYLLSPLENSIDLKTLSLVFSMFVGDECREDGSSHDYILDTDKYLEFEIDENDERVLNEEKSFETYLNNLKEIYSNCIIEFLSASKTSPIVRLISAAFYFTYNKKFPYSVQDNATSIDKTPLYTDSDNQNRSSEEINLETAKQFPQYEDLMKFTLSKLSSLANAYLDSSTFGKTIKGEWTFLRNKNVMSVEDMLGESDLTRSSFKTVGVFGVRKICADFSAGRAIIPSMSISPFIDNEYVDSKAIEFEINPGYTNDYYHMQPESRINVQDENIDIYTAQNLLKSEEYKYTIEANVEYKLNPYFNGIIAFYTGFFFNTSIRMIREIFSPVRGYNYLRYLCILDSFGAQVDMYMQYNSTLYQLKNLYNQLLEKITPTFFKVPLIEDFILNVDSIVRQNRKIADNAIDLNYNCERVMQYYQLRPVLEPFIAFYDTLHRVCKFKGGTTIYQLEELLLPMGITLYKNASKIGGLEDSTYISIYADIAIATIESFLNTQAKPMYEFIERYLKYFNQLEELVFSFTGLQSIQVVNSINKYDIFDSFAEKLFDYVSSGEFDQACSAACMDTNSIENFTVAMHNKVTQNYSGFVNCYDPFLRHSNGMHVVGQYGDIFYFPHEARVFVGFDTNTHCCFVETYTDISAKSIEWR